MTRNEDLLSEIVERKSAEEALRKSEERYRRLFEDAPLMYVITRNEQGIPFVSDCNELFLVSVGYQRDEVVGQPLANFYSPESVAALLEGGGYARALAGEFVMGERDLLTRDGRLIPTLLYTATEMDPAGQVTGTRAMFVNITERKHAEERLRKSEERYRSLFENMREGFAYCRMSFEDGKPQDFVFLDVNDAFERLTGLKDVVGRKVTEVLPGIAESNPELLEIYGRVAFTGNPETFETYVDSLGTWFALSVYSTKQDHFSVVFADITERKRVEEALRASEAQLSNAVRMAHLGHWEYDVVKDLFTFNDHFYQIFRTTAEKVGGYTMSSADYARRFVHPDDLAVVGEETRKAIEATYPNFTRQLEHRILYADGEVGYISVRFFIIKDERGRTIRTYGVNQDITERRRSEEALRKSEERLELALKGADLGLWDLHVPTGRGVINQRSAEIAGYAVEEIDQNLRTWKRALHPEDRQRAVEKIMNHLSGSIDLYEDEYRVRHKSGDWRWILSRGKITERSPDGKPLRMTGTLLDITDKKLAEAQVLEANALREQVVSESPVGIAVYRENGQCISVNESLARIVGSDRESLLSKNFRDLQSWKDGGLLAVAEQVLSEGANFQNELHLTSTFGKSVWANVRMARLLLGGVSNLLIMLNDISERKEAEDALRFEREQLLSLFESINELILVIDPQTYEILYANKFAEDLYGKPLTGGTCYEKLAGLDAPCGYCPGEEIVESDGGPHQWEYSNPILKRVFLATDRLIRWPDGRDVKFQIAVDITALREASQEQDHLRAQLFHAQKMESIGTLAGGIAHDFNNLLTVVLGFSELLLTGKDERDPSYEDLQRIHQAAKHGADLVKRILAFSRKTDIKPRPLDLNHEIEQAMELLTRTLQKMIEVKLVLADKPASVNADPIQIEQILVNLAVNARDAMPEGGTLTIETKPVTLDEAYCRLHLGAEPGDYVMISVSDTGQGMSQETLQHIFEPFYTTKEIGKGTGLGLAMVYGIVKQHGGHITCDSQAGMGTTFNLYFPVIQAEPKSETLTRKPTLSQGTETILLVDDEDFVRDLGKRILERSGYTVLTASNGREALSLYEKERGRISLVILDLIMPDVGGKRCLEELLKIDSQARVLVASGYLTEGSSRDVMEAGAKGFVNKPYEMHQLLQAVRQLLEAG